MYFSEVWLIAYRWLNDYARTGMTDTEPGGTNLEE